MTLSSWLAVSHVGFLHSEVSGGGFGLVGWMAADGKRMRTSWVYARPWRSRNRV